MHKAYVTYEGEIGVRVSYLINDMDRAARNEDDRVVSLRLISYDALAKRAKRTPGLRLREGKGAGNEALYSFQNMPEIWQRECRETFGDPWRQAREAITLEQFYRVDYKASDFFHNYRKPNGETLSKELIETYTENASVLNAVISAMSRRKAYRKALGGSTTALIDAIKNDVEAIRDKVRHTLRIPSLQRTLAKYKKEGYSGLISGKVGSQNASKIISTEQISVLKELLKKHQKHDNVKIAFVYNQVADKLGWKPISESTVANYRKEFDLYIYASNSGETNFRNKRAMQHKRAAPNVPMVYWTLDGWDAELLYQKTEVDKKGNTVTTYHNRPTVVVVLDPCLNYPIGYAVGTHETPELIKAALRNAANHTRDLFGKRYKSLQLQSDHYGKGKLVPIYEAMTVHYTPARVKNAKAKRIEPYFRELNNDLKLISSNWSGYGITSRKESQPNTDYLNKIRHSFPDFDGVCKQIENVIASKRMAVVQEYVKRWGMMADADHVELTTEDYLFLFGETTGYTNRLDHSGVNITIHGRKFTFDSFDIAFREHKFVDWCLYFDPNELNNILAVNAISKDGRCKEIIGTKRFLLEQKYIQPMALFERMDGDRAELVRIDQFNDYIEDKIIADNIQTRHTVEQLFVENPALNDTLSKLVLIDSRGQHKNQRNVKKMLDSARNLERAQIRPRAAERADTNRDREQYLDGKLDINKFYNQS